MAAEIKFDGVMYRDPQEINKQWGNYFANLYTPDEDESFDDNVKLQIENELYEIKQYCQHTGKCIRRFAGIYAYCRYFIERKW